MLNFEKIYSFEKLGSKNMKPKILYFSDCHIYGGSDRNIINLLNYMAEREDLEVFFAYRYFRTYQEGVNRDLSKKVRAIPIYLLSNITLFHRLDQTLNNRFLKKIIKLPFWALHKIGIYALYDYIVLKRMVAGIKPDLIHVNNGGYPGSFVCQIMVFAAKHSGINKIVYHINNQALKQGIWFDKLIDKKINQYTNYFITASRQAYLALAEKRFFDVDKLMQINNTIENYNIITSKKEICKLHYIDIVKFIICEVGFLSQRKGQIYILNALRKIKELDLEIYSKIILFLVGDGEDYHLLRNYCEQNGLNNVIFTGYKANYVDYIACSDIFILPSVEHEDMPLVVLSAMKLGKPIVATEIAGITEEIENFRSGILLKVERLDSLYLEIIKLYRDSNLRQYYGENAMKRFNEHFSQSRVYSEIRALYNKLLYGVSG
jgi:glycosyltransferase involved in cell wall biosynthesis